MEYSEPIPDINKPASQLYEAIKKAAKIDQGTVDIPGPRRPRAHPGAGAGTRQLPTYPHYARGAQIGSVVDRSESVQGTTGWHTPRMALAGARGGLCRRRAGAARYRGRLYAHRLVHLAAPRGVRRPSRAPRRDGVDAGAPDLAARQAVGRQRLSRHIGDGVRHGDYRRRACAVRTRVGALPSDEPTWKYPSQSIAVSAELATLLRA